VPGLEGNRAVIFSNQSCPGMTTVPMPMQADDLGRPGKGAKHDDDPAILLKMGGSLAPLPV